jgi:retinoid hydroxylase
MTPNLRSMPAVRSLPLVGSTLAFLANPDGFLVRCASELGSVFKMRFLGEDVACFVGPEAFKFVLDPSLFSRAGASPRSVEEILHPEAVPFLDGPGRARRKALLMRVFDDEALGGYSKVVERVIGRYATKWAKMGTFRWVPEITSMGLTVAAAVFLGAAPDEEHPEIQKPILRAFNGMLSLPIHLPGTPYARAIAARDVIRARVAESLAKEKLTPGSNALSRLLAARTEAGEQLSDDEIRIEALHFFGAYVAVIGALAFEAMFLGRLPEIKERCRSEIREHMPHGPVTYARMRELPYLERVTKEVRRARTVVPVTFFARANADCAFEGVAVPRGMKALGAIGATLHDPFVFPEPDAFDPDRWLPNPRSDRQAGSWVPHGGGEPLSGHRCAGERMAELMLKAFAVMTLRDFDWDFPPDQSFESTTGKLFATPASGLRVRFRRIAASGGRLPDR